MSSCLFIDPSTMWPKLRQLQVRKPGQGMHPELLLPLLITSRESKALADSLKQNPLTKLRAVSTFENNVVHC